MQVASANTKLVISLIRVEYVQYLFYILEYHPVNVGGPQLVLVVGMVVVVIP
jgi:hypothetical protein